MAEPTWFACENGHPVMPGSTICTACGAQVTSRRVPPPESIKTSSRKPTNLPEPSASSAPQPSPSKPDPEAQKRATLIVALSSAVSLLVAGVVFFVVASQSATNPEPTPIQSAVPMSCAGVAPELALGVEYDDAPMVSCFVVGEETTVSLSARPSEGGSLGLEVERADGVFWAATLGAEGSDSVLSSSFLPGAYIVTVTGGDGGEPGPFTIVVSVGDPDNPWDFSDPSLPGLEDCGNVETPFLGFEADVARLESDGAIVHACLALDDAAFVKLGAETADGTVSDLNLALHEFGPDGRPEFIVSVNDTFGRDPEMSLDLEAGTYLLEIAEVTGGAVGPYSLYAATDPEFHRVGEVSAEREGLSPDDCSSGDIAAIGIGGSQIFTSADPVACVEVDSTQRLVLKAVSFADQDLILEVIGFADDGTPFLLAWVDDDLWATDFDDLDPVLDVNVPAGLYVLAVADYNGQIPHDLMIAVDEAGG